MSATNKKAKWWIFAITTFFIFVVLQVPASWLIAKFYKNNHVLHNVSGNLWQGQADWQRGELKGSLTWHVRPWEILLLRAAAQLEIHSGQTQLDGKFAYGIGKTLYLRDLNGKISPDVLQHIAAGQWPDSPIELQDVQLNYKKNEGFTQAEGAMHWLGGEMRYGQYDQQELIRVPNLLAKLSQDQQKLNVDVRDNRNQKMLNIVLDPSLMLDVQVTQRFLLNAPSYQGQAGLDTYVISSRQPLLRGGV